ncbi:hypothetical protein [Metabacillus dongyingensis]|uniref:hypothetical protein n=1 Tax=Metabacillus dongyingensis TaxID=2874282 RepID=UPI001CC0A962|nr:hypothetical protein [Metabacillus dongyingensis]UAL53504.1 hypothetical protein K8L98_06880 [Metabacillus dongyingensis]
MIYTYALIVVASLVLCLILNVLFRKMKPSTFGHTITHILLYLIEILTVTTIITWLLSGSETTGGDSTLLAVFRNFVFSYTLYQLVLLVTFKLMDSIDTDALTITKNINDKIQLYAEFKKKFPEEDIVKAKAYIHDSGVSFNNKQREYLLNLLNMVQLYNKNEISQEDFRLHLKIQSVELDTQLKMYGYGWMNSVLLRFIK